MVCAGGEICAFSVYADEWGGGSTRIRAPLLESCVCRKERVQLIIRREQMQRCWRVSFPPHSFHSSGTSRIEPRQCQGFLLQLWRRANHSNGLWRAPGPVVKITKTSVVGSYFVFQSFKSGSSTTGAKLLSTGFRYFEEEKLLLCLTVDGQ